MKRVFLLSLFALLTLLGGCKFAKPDPVYDKIQGETQNPDHLVGIFVDINHQFKDYKTSNYLVAYYIHEQSPQPITRSYGEKGFLDASNNITIRENHIDFMLYGTVYYTSQWEKVSIYPLYQKDGKVIQSPEPRHVGVRGIYTFKIEAESATYKTRIEIRFVPIDELKEVQIREYNKAGALLSEKHFASEEEHILQADTAYYIITEVFQDKQGKTYSCHTLKDVVNRVDQERFVKRFSNEYGFVSGDTILIKKSNQ